MKKHLLFALLCLVGITSVQKAYAAKQIFAILHNNQMQIAYDEKANYSGVIAHWSPENGTRNMTESEREQITSVMITNTMSQARPIYMDNWFAGLKNAAYITGLEYLHTENVTTLSRLFEDCYQITSLNVSNFNTSNVTDMSYMFYNCYNLTALDVTNFNTENVTDMAAMFFGCSFLNTLDVTNFNTKNVEDMSWMFKNCASLTALDVTNFNTENVTEMVYMFTGCESLTSLDLSSFNTENVIDMYAMFQSCTALASINLSSFNTSKVKDMRSMFYGCSSLTSLDLMKFRFDAITSTNYMFYECSKLETIYCGTNLSQKTSITSSEKMFNGCTKLKGGNNTSYSSSYTDKSYARPDVSGKPGYFTKKKVLYAQMSADGTAMHIFYDDNPIQANLAWNADGFGTNNMTSDARNKVTIVYFEEGVEEARPKTCRKWFYNLTNLTQISSLNLLNTSETTSMRTMFYGCSSLTSLDVTKFNTANVTTIFAIFYNCSSLTSLDVTKFNTANVTDMSYMFYGCSSLTSLDVTKLNTSNVKAMRSMFYNCSSLTSLDVTKFNTSSVTEMSHMFNRCSSLKSLDLTSFNVEKVDSMMAMFYNDSELKTIYCNDDWSKHNVINSYGMFKNCTALIGDKGTRYDSDYTDITYARPDLNSKPGYFTRKSIQGIEETPSNSPSKGEKILRDGQLLILVGDKTYDARGVEIKK